MAVFPDRIVLKNSTDDEATITAAIQTGGADEIAQGELVLGLTTSSVTLFTKAGDGSIVSFSPGIATGRAIVSDTPPTIGLNSQPLAEGDLWYESDTGSYYVYYSGAWAEVSNSNVLENVVEDLTPQLGGNLDVNGYYLASASGGNVVIAPDTTGGFVVRGNNTDGSITLNCTANTHGVTIQSPPHSAAATYTLILPEDTGTSGQALTTDGNGTLSWTDSTPTGVTSIIAGTNVTVSPANGTGDVTINASGGGGGTGGGERGDGGDFDFGTVDSGFVFGVYGGGDWDTGSADVPEEYISDVSPDGGDFT